MGAMEDSRSEPFKFPAAATVHLPGCQVSQVYVSIKYLPYRQLYLVTN